jgi:hypothetical protein
MGGGLVSCLQDVCLVSVESVPESEEKCKSAVATLSVFSAAPQLSEIPSRPAKKALASQDIDAPG